MLILRSSQNANVLRAVDYHRSKYSALRRRRVFFVFILPAILCERVFVNHSLELRD